MSGEHTRGPWAAQYAGGIWSVTASRPATGKKGGWPYYAICSKVGGDDAERKANARLIASAPETAAERDGLRAVLDECHARIGKLTEDLHCLPEMELALKALRAEKAELVAATRALVNEVSGVWSAFDHDIRHAISNTNYQCVADKLDAVRALVAKATTTEGE